MKEKKLLVDTPSAKTRVGLSDDDLRSFQRTNFWLFQREMREQTCQINNNGDVIIRLR